MSINDAISPSSSADRARRYRVRRAEGRHVARVEVGPGEIEALDVGDRASVGWAIELLLLGLVEGALEIDTDRLIEALDEGE